ncbi:hypothetical protein [Nonomuraea sp. NPDC003214]
MSTTALVTWVVTALGGFFMLGRWLSRRRGDASGRFPVPVVSGHFLLAAAGLVVWIAYLVTGATALAWAALVILVPVALLGFVLLARWIPARGTAAPEAAIPVAVVVAHGVFAVATLVLVLLTAVAAAGG